MPGLPACTERADVLVASGSEPQRSVNQFNRCALEMPLLTYLLTYMQTWNVKMIHAIC